MERLSSMKKYVFGLGSAQVIAKLLAFTYKFGLFQSFRFCIYCSFFDIHSKMQVLVTAVVVGLVAHFVSGQPGPSAIVIGNGLALSSTAVVLQVTVAFTFYFLLV